MRRLLAVAPFVLALACHGKVGGSDTTPLPPLPEGPGKPTPSAAQRLTQAQYRAAIRDLFGPTVVVPPALEPDVVTPEDNGFETTGAARSSISKRGIEQYETAAYSIANQLVADAKLLPTVLPCKPTGVDDIACAKSFATATGRRVFRRALSPDEVTRVANLVTSAAATLGAFERGLVYGLASMLQSPHFLYRPVVGEPDPARPGQRRLTALEFATRLSFFLWNSIPDEALLTAAETGALDTQAGLDKEIGRLLASPKAREGLRAFVREWLRLGDLDKLEKDAKVFTTFSPDLGPMAREETLRVFEDLVFDRDGDLRTVYTTRRTFLTPKLASMYQVPAPSPSDFAATELPESGPRRGILGHVSLLALYAHGTSSSATLRGKFVREKLLCQPIPNPPTNVNTALPEPTATAKTLRDRVQLHFQNGTCRACHLSMDPIGLGLEQFDGIGRLRTKENGALIDPSGTLDGVPFGGPVDLTQAIHDHPSVPACFARKLYQYASGSVLGDDQELTIGRFTNAFVASGHRMKVLIAAIAGSPELRAMGAPKAVPPTSDAGVEAGK